MPRKILTIILFTLTLLMAGITLTACGGANTNNVSSNGPGATQSSPAPPPKTVFEADVEYVRKGQYTYVWVFSRKDGKPLDKEDGAFLKKNAPQVVDWVRSEGSNKVVAGTNFDLAKGNLELLKKRFIAEDYTNK